mmetsp:Transcript_80972/g.225326  ORF Transcript_80972/g.225326 Transcript_80972/m.225326 type:complete len:92 (+) Transcript_80972:175-450(+)
MLTSYAGAAVTPNPQSASMAMGVPPAPPTAQADRRRDDSAPRAANARGVVGDAPVAAARDTARSKAKRGAGTAAAVSGQRRIDPVTGFYAE